jgi:peptidoglycan/xylan/chitin deacetylase (PgdA/CDA1 family)
MRPNPVTFLKNWKSAQKRKSAVKTKERGADIPIFHFHQIGKEEDTPHPSLYLSRKNFERCIRCLASRGYQCVSLSKAVEIIRNPAAHKQKYAVITFDDGYEGVYTEAFQVLHRHEWSATIFLVADKVNAPAHTSFPYLRSPQLKEMIRYGFEMGSHSYHHQDLTSLEGSEALKKEIQDSKFRLEDIVGNEVRHFCYPQGKWNEPIETLVRRAGYQSACSTDLGRWHEEQDLFHLKRISIPYRQSLPQFLYRLEVLSWV